MESKLALARGLVEKWHGTEAAAEAEQHFTRVVRRHEAPEDVAEAPLPDGDPVHLPGCSSSCSGSARRARRAG